MGNAGAMATNTSPTSAPATAVVCSVTVQSRDFYNGDRDKNKDDVNLGMSMRMTTIGTGAKMINKD